MEALRLNKFTRNQMVCTNTLYNYIDKSVMNSRNIDLVAKLRRKPRRMASRVHKRVYGSSIDLRPSSVEDRLEFGHWEIGLRFADEYHGEGPVDSCRMAQQAEHLGDFAREDSL